MNSDLIYLLYFFLLSFLTPLLCSVASSSDLARDDAKVLAGNAVGMETENTASASQNVPIVSILRGDGQEVCYGLW